MSSYRIGYRFEKRFERIARIAGWHPFRHAGSKFPDYVICKKGRCAIVEVKKNRRDVKDAAVCVERLARRLGVEGYVVYYTYVRGRYRAKLVPAYTPDGEYMFMVDATGLVEVDSVGGRKT